MKPPGAVITLIDLLLPDCFPADLSSEALAMFTDVRLLQLS